MAVPSLLRRFTTLTSVLALSVGGLYCSESTLVDYSATLSQAQNNTRPVARAGADREASVGETAVLDGSGSYDPDEDEIVFSWFVHELPEGSTLPEEPFTVNHDRNAVRSGFVPDVEGIYIFGLRVEDASVVSEADFVIYDVRSSTIIPVADAGANQFTNEGQQVCMDGSGSFDPLGAELTYDWTLVTVPEDSATTSADLTDVGSGSCFTPDSPGSYAVALVVNNGVVDSEPDFAFVSAGSTNQGPAAAAELSEGAGCSFVQLSGADSTDPEGDQLNYSWDVLLTPNDSTVPLGSAAFDDPTSETPVFYADLVGFYTVQLVVNDGEAFSAPVFLEFELEMTTQNTPPDVVVSPDAYYSEFRAGCNFNAYGQCLNCPACSSINVNVDALGTTDPDDDPFQLAWSVVQGPSSTALTDEIGWETTLQIPGPSGSCSQQLTTHTVQVQVAATDCPGETGTNLITIVYDCIEQ